ncbi:hypothetical protein BLNAU_14397 [Blattamonas nauphoetae]|uniref:Uncharacterized protein n=1 Tax=Blattamonas nauphoetae TaxID=2049346 RepID=A0ABQ9XKF3_9EUKA|nr:hypothetical protein BLNAU_14397 [Blattamonas nauphoetae]
MGQINFERNSVNQKLGERWETGQGFLHPHSGELFVLIRSGQNWLARNHFRQPFGHITEQCPERLPQKLAQTDLIPPLVIPLNRQSLSFPTLETSPSISNFVLNSLPLAAARALRRLDIPLSFMRMEEWEDTVEGRLVTDRKGAYRSCLQPTLDVSLEAKAVNLLYYVVPDCQESADAFLVNLGQTTDESSTNFVQSIVNELIPQLITTLNPLSLPFAEAEDLHTCLLKTIFNSFWLATPFGLRQLGIADGNEQQAVHETVFKQILSPSENCITFIDDNESIMSFLSDMINAQLEWNEQGGEVRLMGKIMLRMLRMEGIEDVIEAKLQNDKNGFYGKYIVDESFKWNNLKGMNIP